MHKIEVGKLLAPNVTQYQEGPKFDYTPSGPIVRIAFNNPTAKEIEGAKSGTLEMSYYVRGPIIFVCLKIQGCGRWMDMPFSIRLHENVNFDWSDEIVDGQGLAITVMLVDAQTGILKSYRLIGASTAFSRGLRSAILQQYEQSFDKDEYFRLLNETYRSLTSDQIAQRAEGHFKVRRA